MAERGGVTGFALTPYQVSVAAGLTPMTLSTQASGWFGPGQPMAPNVPPEVKGRAFDYPAGYNLNITPKAYEPISFASLRALADTYDLLRLAIETRKDQVARMRWVVKNRDGVKKDYAAPIAAITKFLRKPDGEMGWQNWIRVVLEDLFVLDAPALNQKRDAAGRLLALEHIDGATIKRVIDDFGRTPSPTIANGRISYPVAYQQVLKGQTLNYTAQDLLYRPRNRRSHRVYGFSQVEQIVVTVNIALRRQATTLEYFTDGTVPDAFISVPDTWSPTQIREYQAHWDSLFTGNTAVRRRAKFIPGGAKIQQTREPELKGEFDLWLAKIICFAFSIPASWADRMATRANAQAVKDSSEEEGLAPILDWIKALVDDLITDEFGYPDLEFGWKDDTALDEEKMSAIVEGQVSKGLITINEGRAKLGLDPDPNPAADKLMVMTATGFMLLEANTIEGKKEMMAAFPQPDPPPDDGGAPAGGEQRGGQPSGQGKGISGKPAQGRGATGGVQKLAKTGWEQEARASDGKWIADLSSEAKALLDSAREPVAAAEAAPAVYVVTRHDAADGSHEVKSVSASHQKATERHAQMVDEEGDDEDLTHEVKTALPAAAAAGDRVHVVSSADDTGNVTIHGVHPDAGSAKEQQNRLLKEKWAKDGADLDYEDIWNDRKTERVWTDEVAAWNAAHGDEIDPDNFTFGSNPQFEDSFSEKYLKGKKAPYPGAKRANEYFYGSGDGAMAHHIVERSSHVLVKMALGAGDLAKAGDPKPERIDADDQEAAIAAALEPALGKAADEAAAQVAATLKDQDGKRTKEEIAAVIAAILASLSFGSLTKATLVMTIAAQLRDVAENGARRGIAEATDGAPPSGPEGEAVEAAADVAEDRAAEMVGLKWVSTGGTEADMTLAPDPGAGRNIIETLRAKIAAAVEKSLGAGGEVAAVADAVRGLGVFGKTHAKTIAAAEAMAVGNKGLMLGYQASGVALRKRWNILAEACLVCQKNAAEGLVPLNHVFSSGHTEPCAHPECRCVISCEQVIVNGAP